MGVLHLPRHRKIQEALDIARSYYQGHLIDGQPALAHAVQVVVTLERYVPDPPPDAIAGILLHDMPEYAPDKLTLHALLRGFGVTAHRIVSSIEREHDRLARWAGGMTAEVHACVKQLSDDNDAVLLAGSADKIVAFTSVLRRSDRAADARVYWHGKRPLVVRLPYFREYHRAVAHRLPAPMADELSRLIDAAETSASRAGCSIRPSTEPAFQYEPSRMVRDVITPGD